MRAAMLGLLAAILAVAAFAAAEGGAMSKVFLFSKVDGVAFLDGKPAAGAEVERMYDWAWGGKAMTDQAVTDADGAFQFPAVSSNMILGGILPHQPLIIQTIAIKYQGKNYEVWAYAKMDYRKNSELRGNPINVTCHLEREAAPLMGEASPYGLCVLRKGGSGKASR